MIKQLFPAKHVAGYILSLILTLIALSVIFYDLPYTAAMGILIITAVIQAGVQLFMFMHVGESADKKDIYANLVFGIFVALVIIFGTLLTMIWGHAHH